MVAGRVTPAHGRGGAPGNAQGRSGEAPILVKPPPTSSRSPWRERLVLASGTAAMVLALLAPGLRPGGIVFGWDTVGEHFAWESWVWDRYASGRSALWNSHVSCGFPFPAQGTTGVFYPLAFPHLFLSPGQASDVVLVLHLWLLAAGCAAFVRTVGGGVGGALLAAAASLASGPIVGSVLLGGRAQTFALAWVPWMLVVTEVALARRESWRFALGGGVVGLSLLAGQPFATAQGLAGALGYGCLRLGGKQAGARSALLRACAGWGVMVGVGALVAAPQLAAWLEYRPRAGGQGELPSVLSGLGALPPRQLLGLLFPGFFGDEASTPYWGHFLLSVVDPYLGWAVLVVLPAALAARFRRVAAPLLALAGMSLLLAMGGHVPMVHALWSRLPGADAFHFPARWLALFAITSSLAAGLGAAHLIDSTGGDREWSRVARVASVLTAAALACLVAMSAGGARGRVPAGWKHVVDAALQDPLRSNATQEVTLEAWIPAAYATSRTAVWRGLGVAIATAVMVRLLPGTGARMRAAGLVAVVVVDAGSWAWRYGARVDPGSLELPDAVTDRVRAETSPSRYATTLAPLDTPGPRELVRHYAGLDQYAQMPMHAGMVAGVDALQWGSYGLESVNRAVNGGTIFAQAFPTDRRWLDFLGVRWLVAPAGVAGADDLDGLRVSPESRGYEALRKIADGAGFTLFENPRAQQRARLVREPIVVADEQSLAARRAEPGFDPSSDVLVLERDLGAQARGARALDGTAGRVVWRERDDGRMRMGVSSPEPTLLVVAESNYPGWRVSVDGAAGHIVEVDGAFLGVEVPAGESEVVFQYRPGWLWPSMGASAVGIAAVCGAALATRLRREDIDAGASGSPRLAVAESP